MKKEKIVAFMLISMMIFLIGAIFYFSYLLMETPTEEKTTSAVAPKKTKAQVATSEKFIALNQPNNNPSPTPTTQTSPSSSTPTPTKTPTPTQAPTTTQTLTQTITPTPTEVILAKASSPTVSPTSNTSSSPTEVSNLPSSGDFNRSLFIFGAAALLLFYSLIF